MSIVLAIIIVALYFALGQVVRHGFNFRRWFTNYYR